MSYSLVIAEDEQMMRNGLTKMIRWEELGFEVRAVFSDGAEVMAYLHQNLPDVLLMDIKMVTVSGLEVTQFIVDNKIPVKVVLLSGHRSFEYAQQAVELNVEHYLLKPISVPKLKQVFSALRDRLDSQSSIDESAQYRIDRYNQIVNYEKQQFVLDALLGGLTEPEALARRLALVTEPDGQGEAIVLFELALQQDDKLRQFLAGYGSQELEEQLIHLLESYDDRLDFYLIENYNYKLTGLFWRKPGGEAPDYEVKQVEPRLAELVRMMTGLDAQISVLNRFDSAAELAQYRRPQYTASTPDIMRDADPTYFHHLREQKKLMLTDIRRGDAGAALQIFTSFTQQCMNLGISFLRDELIHFFTLVAEKISDEDPRLYSELMGRIRVVEVTALSGGTELTAWGEARIRSVITFLSEQGKLSNGSNCIPKVQRYIQENYAKDLTLSEVAEQVYLNPIYLSRIFKERAGQTFTEYLSAVRIAAAVDYLENSKHFVYEICELVGYHNLKYFYKIFKKMTGCSPSEYRERVGNVVLEAGTSERRRS